jgi:2-polyprenyl-6-methoxyphenol hydroxylase-like FAD-dependent oxidoreductase
VRRQAGIPLQRQRETHLIVGMLVDAPAGVVGGADFVASTTETMLIAFQQGGGRMRVYLCPGAHERNRYSGPHGVEEFRRAIAGLDCLPDAEDVARGAAAGPLAVFPGDNTWTDEPCTDGVVLVGDAAGHISPVTGQGLSLAMRDARLVRDAIRAGDWSPAAFADYTRERAERLRRERFIAEFNAAAFSDECDDRLARLARYFKLVEAPLAGAMLFSLFAGPETAPGEAFDGTLLDALLGRERSVRT